MEFNQKTLITLVGVSANPEKYGHKIFKDLLASGYNVVGVNPKGETILEQTIIPNLEEVSRPTELLLVVVPPEIGITVLTQAKKIGIQNIWLQPGAESKELIQFAQQNNLNLTYNKCFMVDQGIW